MNRSPKPETPTQPAMAAALTLLSHRARTEQELRLALARKGYAPEQVQEALLRCRELGYIDDERYAQSLARDLSRVRKLGDRAIAMRLARRGISQEVVRAAVGSLAGDDDSLPEKERARALFKRKFPNVPTDPKERNRAVRFLQARGFGWSVIADVLGGDLGDAPSD